jgi:hypothetical protein
LNDVTQTEIQTAEPLVPEPRAFEVQMAEKKKKRHRSPGTDYILAEMIKAGGMTICSEIHKFINSIWNKDDLLERSGRVIKQIVVIIDAYHFCQLHKKLYPASCCQG